MPNFKPQRAWDLIQSISPEIKWVWKGFIPDGALALLSAYMKVGKTTFVYALIKAVARGEPFLDFPTRKCGVLVIAVEEHQRDIRNRLEAFGVTESEEIYLHIGSLDRTLTVWDGIKAFCKEKSIGLVVIDTLSRFVTVDDENDNALITKELTPLLDMAHESDIAILLVHHTGKGDGDGGRNIRGASALFASVDQALVMALSGQRSNGQRKISTYGRYTETPLEMTISLDDRVAGEYSLMEIGKTEDDELLDGLYLKMAAGAKLTVEQAAEVLKVKPRRLQKLLKSPPEWMERTGAGVKGDPFVFGLKVEKAGG